MSQPRTTFNALAYEMRETRINIEFTTRYVAAIPPSSASHRASTRVPFFQASSKSAARAIIKSNHHDEAQRARMCYQHAPIQEHSMKRLTIENIICTILVALFVINQAINLSNWIRGIDDGQPKYGQQCGPAHHWIYVRTSVADADLSCEMD